MSAQVAAVAEGGGRGRSDDPAPDFDYRRRWGAGGWAGSGPDPGRWQFVLVREGGQWLLMDSRRLP